MSSKNQNINNEPDMSFQESSVEVTINEGCFEYVLYVPSLWRQNCNVVLPFGDLLMQNEKELCRKAKEVGININDYNFNPFAAIQEFLPKKYNDLITRCKARAEPHWYFMGCSDTGILSWLRCPSAAWSIEQYLEGVLPGAKLVKIVLTAALGENDTPICLPYQCFNGKYQKFKYKPCITLGDDDGTIEPIAIVECNEQWYSFKYQNNNYSRKSFSRDVNEGISA